MRTVLTITTATLAVAIAGSAQAQSATIDYRTGQYEYAQPDPQLDNDVVTETVPLQGASRSIPPRAASHVVVEAPVFVSQPVVQPIAQPVAASRSIPPRSYQTVVRAPVAAAPMVVIAAPQPRQVVYAYPAQMAAPAYAYSTGPVPAARSIPRQGAAAAAAQPVVYGYEYDPQAMGSQAYLPAGGQLVSFDRSAWLAECNSRLSTHSQSDRGKVLGALLGGAAGAVLGNRIAGQGNRTVGGLIGAGAGAAAGMAIGDAIDDSRRRDSSDAYGQCEAYLDDYMRNASETALSTAHTQGGQYMLVPVTVAVPQQAVYSDGTPVR